MRKWIQLGVSVLALSLIQLPCAEAASLPKATQKVLAKLKLDSSILNGLDAELDVPKAWVDGAAKEEGGVIILGTWRDTEFRAMTAAFNVELDHASVRSVFIHAQAISQKERCASISVRS